MNKADLYKAYKVLDFSHKKIEMELNDMKDEIQYAEKIADSKKSSWETNKRLLKENTQLKEKNNGYEALLRCECGVSIERVVEIKEENKKLKLSRTREAQEYYALSKSYDKLKEENEKLKEKYEKYRVRNCDRMEELVKALSPWKKNHEDHKRILEAIVELKEEHQKLKEELKRSQNADEELWEERGALQVEVAELKEENEKLLDDIELHPDYQETIKSTIEEFIKSMKEKIDEESDDEEVSFCGVNGHRCEECTDCARSKVCDTCKCVGGCYEDCLSNS